MRRAARGGRAASGAAPALSRAWRRCWALTCPPRELWQWPTHSAACIISSYAAVLFICYFLL